MKIGNLDLGDKPVILAPMEDVTEAPFRLLCKKSGADMVFTEFIAAEGLIREINKTKVKILFSEEERPVGIQLFGNNAESLKKAVIKAEEYKPDVIDLNFGCPVKKIVGKGCGAALLRDIPKMIAITRSVVESTSIPVTVKTRIGWDESDKPIVELSERLQDVGIKAITVHGRTRSQLYTGYADWSVIGKVKNNPNLKIPVIGNGDITDAITAKEKFDQYGVDGIMIGRASIGNPWIFKQIKHYFETGQIMEMPDIAERVKTCLQHLADSLSYKNEFRAVMEMRKHYTNYFKGIPHFKHYRIKLMSLKSYSEVFDFLNEIAVKEK